jgi:serpin B
VAAARTLASADTRFAVALYGPAVAAIGAGQNAILSPYSVAATLTMLAAGAAGETASQMAGVLALSAAPSAMTRAYATLACEDESAASGGQVLTIANSLWIQEGASFNPAFVSVLSGGFGAPLRQVDFAASPADAVGAINRWVSGETMGQIPTILSPADVDALTRLVLVDAVDFRGTWAVPFDASRTAPRPFTLSDGSAVVVPTMDGSMNVRTFRSGTTAVTELPYTGGGLAMDFLVPGGALANFEATLTADAITALVAGLGPSQRAEVFLPKFAFATHAELGAVLAALGMPDAFDGAKADFSGIDGRKDLSVKAVVQQARVEVDEQGTTAAAATGVTTVTSFVNEVPIATPFVFLVRDTANGSILFMGRVVDPRGGT